MATSFCLERLSPFMKQSRHWMRSPSSQWRVRMWKKKKLERERVNTNQPKAQRVVGWIQTHKTTNIHWFLFQVLKKWTSHSLRS